MVWKLRSLLLLFVCGVFMNSAVLADNTRFQTKVFKNAKGLSLNYRILLPKSYDSKKAYPLVLFLHGAGERGLDNSSQLNNVVYRFADDDIYNLYDAIVLAPQCPQNKRWAEIDWDADTVIQPDQQSDTMGLVVELLELVKKSYAIDSNRLYVMGLSMGGYGTWDIISRYPEMFAAAVPICGGADLKNAKKIAHMPIWVFHSADDDIVSVFHSRDMVDSIKTAGGKPIYTEFTDAGHNSWDSAFATPALLPWLFSQVKGKSPADIDWYNARYLGIGGKGWGYDLTNSFYDRLPGYAKENVTEPVWWLSHNTAGMYLRFTSESPSINVRWSVLQQELGMHHMPPTGVSGLDIYAKQKNGNWRWMGTASPFKYPENEATIVSGLEKGVHEFMMYLPLYNGVTKLEIGVPAQYTIDPISKELDYNKKPIVIYGTSITQGACASRPGMAWTNIVSREIDYPIINLGFSGSGKMEPYMADLISEIDASVMVLATLENMDAAWVIERMSHFVYTYRQKHPLTPIVIVEQVNFPSTDSDIYASSPLTDEVNAKNAAVKKVFAKLKSENVRNIYLVKQNSMLGLDGEATVDGIHPSDIGMTRMAKPIAESLRRILAK